MAWSATYLSSDTHTLTHRRTRHPSVCHVDAVRLQVKAVDEDDIVPWPGSHVSTTSVLAFDGLLNPVSVYKPKHTPIRTHTHTRADVLTHTVHTHAHMETFTQEL